jgi:hypothetical protein
MQRIGAVLLVGAILAFLWDAGHPRACSQGERFAPAIGSTGDGKFAAQGVASCASTACHHSAATRGVGRNEYTIWTTKDPHAKAYALLFDEPAQKIVKNLQGPDARPAPENLLCLNCHVQPGLETMPGATNSLERPSGLVLADGVGCESCHGAAEKWLRVHYLPDWQQRSLDEKAALGLRPTKDLVTRAQICVTCHVGAGNLDVNHDLIAAGHPRLRFEYAAYLANLPKHWDEAKDRRGHPAFDMQIWAIGQIVSMEAALKLLEHRATTPGKPWPELSEYGCFGCHHVLADDKWRRHPKYLKQQEPGSVAWGTWYYPLAAVLAEHPPRTGLSLPEVDLKGLERSMRPPYTDAERKRVGQHAAAASKHLTGWVPGLRQPGADWDVPALASALQERIRTDVGSGSWDQATQLYLAFAAQRPVGARKALLTALWQSLEFPAGYESPRGFDPKQLGERLNALPPARR